MAKEKWYINESELDDYQHQIVRRKLESSFIVKGCAGSGKTVLALWRAKELQEKGIEDYLVIVFTKALMQFIDDGIAEIGVPASKVTYYWHWKNRMDSRKADYIIIDEVQDFDENELTILQAAARKNLILFGDSAQQLYAGLGDKGKLLTMEEIQVKTQIPMENLVINHRLPKKIARISEQITLSQDPLEGRCKKEGVNKPRLVHCKDLNEQLEFIKDVIVAQNYTDVAILVPTNDQVDHITTYYNNVGFGIERKIRSSMNFDFSSENPKVMTYHSAKGLQFEAVFLPSCVADDFKDRNPLYVATTRPYRDLYILHSNYLSKYIDNIDKALFEVIDETIEKDTEPAF